MPSPGLSEAVTTTLRNRQKKLTDNISENTALLSRLKSRGNQKPVSGGLSIVEELEYAENGTYKRYSGYEKLDISPSDVFTAAEFEWKQAAVAVSISGLEQLKNSSKEQMINLLESRIKNAEKTMMNNLSGDIYSDGTADGGKQIGGLQLLVSDDPTTGTVGGIDAGSWEFWRNEVYDFSVEGVTPGSDTIQHAMNKLYISLTRNNDKPDLIVCDNEYYLFYLESLQPQQRMSNAKMADAGFQNLKFMGADVVFDGGFGGSAPAGHMYFLNTDYIKYRPHKDRNCSPMDPDRYAVDQDAMVKMLGWAGNMTTSNRSMQGVIID